MTEPVIPEKRKKGPPKKRRTYGLDDRAHAMVVVDFFEGDIRRSARMLGMPERTLRDLTAHANADTDPQSPMDLIRKDGVNSVLNVLIRFLEAILIVVLMKSGDAPVRELYVLAGIILDKIEDINKRMASNAQRSLVPAPVPEPVTAATTPEVKAPEVDPAWQREKEKWENTVKLVMADAEQQGNPVSREDAINAVVQGAPEAAVFLEETAMQYSM